MITLRERVDIAGFPRLLDLWRGALEANHELLSAADMQRVAERIAWVYTTDVELTVAELDGEAIGFSAAAQGELGFLFVHHAHRGKGVGRMLLEHALANHPEIDVELCAGHRLFDAVGLNLGGAVEPSHRMGQ